MANPLPSSPSPEQLLLDLLNPQLREKDLQELSKTRGISQELAPLLWHSVGTISLLLQEIIVVYPYLSPPTLTLDQSKRVCHALMLFQCVASHNETRRLLLSAQITTYLLPLINTSNKSKAFEYMRLTCLGVFGELVKAEDKEVIRFLLSTEIVPIFFRAIKNGTGLSKTVGTFIIQKVLEEELGLEYICNSADRFFSLTEILAIMVAERPSPELLKIILSCYLCLTDNQRACHALGTCLPMLLMDAHFNSCLFDEDQLTMQHLQQLLQRVGVLRRPPH